MTIIILIAAFLLCAGAAASAAVRSQVDTPPIFYNDDFRWLITLFWIPALAALVWLALLNWTIAIFTAAAYWLTGQFLWKPLGVYVIVLPIYFLLSGFKRPR